MMYVVHSLRNSCLRLVDINNGFKTADMTFNDSKVKTKIFKIIYLDGVLCLRLSRC